MAYAIWNGSRSANILFSHFLPRVHDLWRYLIHLKGWSIFSFGLNCNSLFKKMNIPLNRLAIMLFFLLNLWIS